MDADLVASREWGTVGGMSLLPAVMGFAAAHRGPIRAARFTDMSFEGHAEELRRLILRLRDRGVEDLVLVNNPFPFGLQLPKEILTFYSLQRLHLGFWQFPSTAACLPNFKNLRELGVHHCIFPDTDMAVLLEHSPHLEVLAVALCREHPTRPQLANRILRVASGTLRIAVAWMCSLEKVVVDGAPCLEKLLLHNSLRSSRERTAIDIISAPVLNVLGFVDLSKHEVIINNIQIKGGMDVKADAMIPSVKILGVKMDSTKDNELLLLAALLKCFPSLQTLHIMSVSPGSISGMDAGFWDSQGSIECLRFRLRAFVLHGFYGKPGEFQFLRYLVREGKALRTLGVVCDKGVLERQWALTSSSNSSVQVIVIPQSAHLPFNSMEDTSVWTQAPFSTLVLSNGQGHGLEALPSILMEEKGKAETDNSGIEIQLVSHTWCFHSATDLTVDDPFCELIRQIA